MNYHDWKRQNGYMMYRGLGIRHKDVPKEVEPVPTTSPTQSQDPTIIRSVPYFGGVVEVQHLAGDIVRGHLSEMGQEKIKAFSHKEIHLYFDTILENFEPRMTNNMNFAGPIVSAMDYMAFRTLAEAVILRLKNSDTSDKINDRYEIAKGANGKDGV
jgi:hypothetical protein